MSASSGIRDRAWDIAGIAFALLVALVTISDGVDTGSMSDTRAAGSIVLALAAAAALWWRRRWPVALAVLTAFPTIYTEAVGGAELVAIFTVASMRSWRVTIAVVALHEVASMVSLLIWEDHGSFVSLTVLSLALLSIPAAWGIVTKSRREVIESLRERAERAESEAQIRAESVRGIERERIAREMHDALAHRISLVSLHAGALEMRPDAGPAEVESIASTIRSSAHGALEDLREILGVLRSGDTVAQVRPQPGIGDIDELIEDSIRVGVTVDHVDELPASVVLSPTTSRTVHRVVQEGLTNARKHAPGSAVRCRIRLDDNDIRVVLENDLGSLSGTEVPGAQSGLIGLTERLSLAGGRIEHGVRRRVDGALVYRLEAWLPWQK